MLDNLTVAVKISFLKFKVKDNFLYSVKAQPLVEDGVHRLYAMQCGA
jgi:hypothetical protein